MQFLYALIHMVVFTRAVVSTDMCCSRYLSQEQLAMIRPKAIAVLQHITKEVQDVRLATVVCRAWLTFLRAVDDTVLMQILSQVVVALLPLMDIVPDAASEAYVRPHVSLPLCSCHTANRPRLSTIMSDTILSLTRRPRRTCQPYGQFLFIYPAVCMYYDCNINTRQTIYHHSASTSVYIPSIIMVLML